ncbi:MAG TPA: right-handed parallel beta-helix repeat-containing protein [Thermoanaerobaculia bacterium]|nr:right-handed parallel beta-helix repeat-containing protein [Thermoanaerobaculia bacterium]
MTVANANPGADTIAFNIPGPGVHTIAPITPLPPLTDVAGVTIDGYTQPGAHPNTLAVGNDATLRIELSGALAGEQVAGLDVRSPATIRGLVINRFDRVGISIRSSEVTVVGCFVGTDPTGSAALPNRYGISAFPEDPKVVLPLVGIVIGGRSAEDRNLVSGNVFDGVSVFASSGTEFLGNYIGTNAAGDAALPNGGAGIVVNSSEKARVGGGEAAARNVLSGNLGAGVLFSVAGQSSVEGNLIGTSATGKTLLPNSPGVWAFGSQQIVIGGATPDLGNVIAGNRIHGVRLSGFSTMNNSILGNSIRDNGSLGIDLGSDGVSPNDAGDGDGGPNFLQNFPVLSSANVKSGQTTISGTLNRSPKASFRVEFFSSDACDPSGFGEGANFLGSANVTIDMSGNASFAVTLSVESSAGQVVTATATDPNGNTSEFSACQSIAVGQQFFTVAPCRVVDTRNAVGPLGGPALAGHSDRTFALAGTCGIPSSAMSVAANLTVTQAVAPGHLTTHRAGTGTPLASTINFSAGQTRANNAIPGLSMDGTGSVTVENAAAGPVHFILDVSGYFE